MEKRSRYEEFARSVREQNGECMARYMALQEKAEDLLKRYGVEREVGREPSLRESERKIQILKDRLDKAGLDLLAEIEDLYREIAEAEPSFWQEIAILKAMIQETKGVWRQTAGVLLNRTIHFGRFGQDGEEEDLCWQVLKIERGRALLLSKNSILMRPYHTKKSMTSWEESGIRKWLNEDFYRGAFNSEEKQAILKTEIPAHLNPKYVTDPGETTKDRIFLLSLAEIQKYLPEDADRRCKPTDYSRSRCAYLYENDPYSRWWTRTPGDRRYSAAIICADGTLETRGEDVDTVGIEVRPAFWIALPLIQSDQQGFKLGTSSCTTLNPHTEEWAKTSVELMQGIVEWGKYPTGEKGEISPLRWKVLMMQGKKALLLSVRAIEAMPFHKKAEATDWENSSLRRWLNKDFLKKAFTEDEQEKILTTSLLNEGNSEIGIRSGDATEDKVFLMSIQEAGRFWGNDRGRCCRPTPYTQQKGIAVDDTDGETEYCWYWLRTMGGPDSAALVSPDGVVAFAGEEVIFERVGVRPLLWVELN